MKDSQNNFAFIDSQNLNLAIREQGWRLDWQKFRIYLRDKYGISKAYLFIGYKPGNEALYTFLQKADYLCIFKPTLELSGGRVKGNVDAELVLHEILEIDNYNRAVIVSGDGDFYCLIEHLLKVDKLEKVLVPNQKKYSALLKRLSSPLRNIFDFVSSLKGKLEYRNEKGSRRD
ncbi:MAG: hypothetical protein A3G52_03115 [Candidatus Taylorbacteria bacterium RIFCSPLOWO2_12_FULL_43_20]|uniref:NYN domain-containing protein n=1 Tax=Candidatus Taylorbacteria bacterium RIFCSPLOWO2_12_FULL_43_20 TaxID=1802332 RepID=A0A1G2P4Y6_9BACT|nr:MAG: hypothetical protein A2825_03730 [Candidatus Taylorbacteria bacterium RIFCSPHIGHO2_01_FULL_43_120]OHA22058.1 MAG: hypothetical protein A3B98_04115 [Candidatus Taylorbacteria bacterium RIFCSPHIGHO2_02_FULL_43_55]OHA30363.1 MAG: hypothetical protein A3E92_00660 [Candidatus Taylorbacteria bacterium RIFCSPHIGHO2_12_FULL_42_34]OHA31031.1 MAG: hypothetical protein A3B09_04060 [Candidatus Taylorbacteria bacterium RIFCSPLOWO2_01_FULL_43_83]OHA39733.1 MAG: hypothetical protein A3H58_04740 [Candi